MTDWGLAADFDIDDGSLDGLTDQQIFVLGVEWGMLYQQLDDENSRLVLIQIHTENAERLMRLCRRKGREAIATDKGDGWTEIRFMTNEEARRLLERGTLDDEDTP